MMNRGVPGKSAMDSSQQQSSVDKSQSARRLKGSNSNNKAEDSANNAKQSQASRSTTGGIVKKSGNTRTSSRKTSKIYKLQTSTKPKPQLLISIDHQAQLILPPHQESEKDEHGDSKLKFTMKVQQQDSGEALTHSKKKEGKSKAKPEETPPEVKEVPPPSDTNGKSSESPQDPPNNGVQETKNGNEPQEIIIVENESSASEVIEAVEIPEELVSVESAEKPAEKVLNVPQEQKPIETEVNPAESVVESTTQEADGKSEEKSEEKVEEQPKPEDDPSFIIYDSSIMLKDVQIKLNDCLKDNSKLMDVTDPSANVSEAFKDLSFGRTLRNISGRSSIGRMRHVTLRERQLTPNNSLFVNTSFLQDEDVNFFADSPNRNGARFKRKLDNEPSGSPKKFKLDESSILNTSLEYIKNLRRPVQVSTPKPKGYKFDLGEKSDQGMKNVDRTLESSVEPKKWCILM